MELFQYGAAGTKLRALAEVIAAILDGGDTMPGGGGGDVFQFRVSDRMKTIQDFRQGLDRIEILSGANAFGAVNIEQDGANVLISFARVQIRVLTDNDAALDEGDFIF